MPRKADPSNTKQGICNQCQKEFSYRPTSGHGNFCSYPCYRLWSKAHRRCKDCSKDRCKEHGRLKTARWRAEASKKELKAKSLQASYRFASGNTRTLTLTQARELINNPPNCPYCGKTIEWNDLSIDHKIPKSRGGSNDEENLVWVDFNCNMVKGNLADTEFTELLAFMEDHPQIKPILTQRLKAGSGFIFNRIK